MMDAQPHADASSRSGKHAVANTVSNTICCHECYELPARACVVTLHKPPAGLLAEKACCRALARSSSGTPSQAPRAPFERSHNARRVGLASHSVDRTSQALYERSADAPHRALLLPARDEFASRRVSRQGESRACVKTRGWPLLGRYHLTSLCNCAVTVSFNRTL